MMSFDKFVEWIADDLRRLLGENYKVEAESVRKNNGIMLKALTIRCTDDCVAPVIYMEPLYKSYKNGSSIDKLIQTIMRKIENERPISFMMAENTQSLERVRDFIVYRLISKSKNEELLKDIPWTEWNDLAIIYYLYLSVNEDKQMTTIIHNYQTEKWNLSVDELHELAKENTPKLCPSTIGRLDHIILGLDECAEEMITYDTEHPMLYVLSNITGINGAACMLYDGVIKSFADEMDSSLIILPSSIHEVLLIKYDEAMDLEVFKNMVRRVNEEDVPAEDILSDNVYIYDRLSGEIRVAE